MSEPQKGINKVARRKFAYEYFFLHLVTFVWMFVN